MSRFSHINKGTAVSAIAACAVIGATSPVWADNGQDRPSPGAPHAASAQDATVISTLRAEIAKLQTQLQADEAALHDATQAASQESRALAAARADAARWKALADRANASVSPTSLPAVAMTTPPPAPAGLDPAAFHHCHHRFGDFRDSGGFGPYGDRGDWANQDWANQDGGYDAGWHH